MEKDPRLGFLGILYVSRRAMIGEDFLSHLDKVRFVVKANNLTSNQSKSIEKMVISRHIPMDDSFTSAELGNALGHDEINFIGIVDKKAALAYVSKSLKGAKHEEK